MQLTMAKGRVEIDISYGVWDFQWRRRTLTLARAGNPVFGEGTSLDMGKLFGVVSYVLSLIHI